MKQLSIELTVKKPTYFKNKKVHLNVSNREARILKAQLMKDFYESENDSLSSNSNMSNLNFEDICICLGAGNKDFFNRLNDETLCYIGDGCFCKRRCMLAEDA